MTDPHRLGAACTMHPLVRRGRLCGSSRHGAWRGNARPRQPRPGCSPRGGAAETARHRINGKVKRTRAQARNMRNSIVSEVHLEIGNRPGARTGDRRGRPYRRSGQKPDSD